MNATSIAILQTVAATDPSLSPEQRTLLQDLVAGRSVPQSRTDQPLLLTQKEAARTLSVSRVTLWRMTRQGILTPVEIMPGMFRYRFDDIATVARGN